MKGRVGVNEVAEKLELGDDITLHRSFHLLFSQI